MIDDIPIDHWSSRNFAIIEDIKKKIYIYIYIYNLMVDLSKFTSNKKILSGFLNLVYNQVCCQTLIILSVKKFMVVINLASM